MCQQSGHFMIGFHSNRATREPQEASKIHNRNCDDSGCVSKCIQTRIYLNDKIVELFLIIKRAALSALKFIFLKYQINPIIICF